MNDKVNLIAGLMSRPPRQQTAHNLQQEAQQQKTNAQQQTPRNQANLLDSMMLGPECHRATSGASGRTTAASSAHSGNSRQHKLKQRFTVIRKLGKGTYGKVQLAINKETGQEVAIKTIKKTKIETDQDLQRVRREIQIMSSIEHPHIIHIYEVFENKDKIVLVMQYAPGGELYEYVSQSKVLDDQEARRLFRQIATAIFYCHQNKICHRDLKLENILLDEKNNAKLADFGLSNVFDKRRQLRTFCGSPLYASPEIVRGLPYEGPEVDCWSLGVLLYTLVYGAMPFDGSNFKRLVKQISEATYYEPKQKSQASSLIHKLLCANPTERATILDICSDPWVNGACVPSSPRLPLQTLQDLNQNQQQPQSHNSLLKVAQDMANLTPVRLDILLALRPESPPTTADELPPVSQRKSKTPERPPPPTAPRKTELDPQVMRMYEQRETSPVASYVVRDLDTTNSSTRMDTSRVSVPDAEMRTEADEKLQDEEVKPIEVAEESAAPKFDAGETQESDVLPVEVAVDLPKEEPAEVETPTKPEEPQHVEPMLMEKPEFKEEIEERVTATEVVAMEVDKMPEPQASEKSEVVVDQEAETTIKPEPQQTLEVPAIEAEVSQESSAASPVPGDEATSGDNAKQGDNSAEGSATDKPKKMVKKKVVVVKRVKKKTAKRDGDAKENEATGSSTANQEQAASETPETKANDQSKPKTVKVKVAKGPGKVKIPSTFTETQQGAAAPSEPPQTPGLENRRQSTLVADVTEKLLQHRQSVSPGASAAAVRIDQPQLVNVRVSDKKDEFERRASVMAANDIILTGTRSGRGSVAGQELIVASHEEPVRADGVRETLSGASFESTGAQLVDRLQPYDPPTELRGAPKLEPQAQHFDKIEDIRATLSKFSADLSGGATPTRSSLDAGQPRDERSDSAETIRAEESPARPTSNKQQPTVRSTLRIDLSGAQNEATNSEQPMGRHSVATTADSARVMAAGPAPIARSYKKVTFTKDGACITETGKIYSSKNDDGTIRRIERKSKVTHYPSDSNDRMSSAPQRREEIHEEEVIMADDQSGGWAEQQQQRHSFVSSSTSAQVQTPSSRRPFERLIMPASEFMGHDEFSNLNDDDSAPFVPPSRRSPFPRHHDHPQQYRKHQQPMSRADSASSCSSGSTDIFDDIFDTWTGAISMFNQGRRASRELGQARGGGPLNDPFGQSVFATLRRRHRKPSGGSRRSHGFGCPSSASGTPRCESVEPQTVRAESPQFPVQHMHQAHQQGHRQAHSRNRLTSDTVASGYESDSLPPFERPASALGSARGPIFGSSHLTKDPFALEEENPFGLDFEPIGHRLVGAVRDPFAAGPSGNLARDLEIEHENMRRRLMQQHRQIWKGSTPSLFSDASGGGHQSAQVSRAAPFWPHQQPSDSNLMRQRSNTSSLAAQGHSPNQRRQQHQQQQAVSESSSGLLRQSIALDAAPNRKPTGEHLPPRLPDSMRRSVSRSSVLANQLANLQLDEMTPGSTSQTGGQPATASATKHVVSFIELKRTSSSSSKLNLGGQQQQQQVQSQSLISSTSKVATSTSGTSSAFWEGRVSPVEVSTIGVDPTLTFSKQQVVTTSESISQQQQQAQETSDDKNIRENRDSRIQNWLQESAGNLSTSSGFKSSASDTGPGGGSRCGLVDSGFPTKKEATSVSLDCPAASQARSTSPLIEQATKLLTETTSEELVQRSSLTGARGRPVTAEATKTTRATIVLSDNPSPTPGQATSGHVVHHHIIEQQQQQQQQHVQQQPVRSSPPVSLVRNTEGLQWIQAMDSNSRLFGGSDDLDGADSMSGAGSADLESSSSLLDQLRSRGYRSMINQRMGAQAGEPQQQRQQVVTSSLTSVADSGGRVITTTTLTTSGITTTTTTNVIPPLPVESGSEEATVISQQEGQAEQSNYQIEAAASNVGSQPVVIQMNGLTEQVNGTPETGGQADQTEPKTNGNAPDDDEEEEEEDDDDIKRAKANIKGYLDRMKETENFLKSIQEAESNFERQRQQMLLFDNLFMSTKLNGIKRCGFSSSSFDEQTPMRVPQTAPANWSPYGGGSEMSTLSHCPMATTESNGFMSNAFHAGAFEPTPTSYGGNTSLSGATSSYNMFSNLTHRPTTYQAPPNGTRSPAAELMTTTATTTTYSPLNHDLNIYRAANYHEHDPLEPVRPLVSASIYPKANFVSQADRSPMNWRRSKSQLSDQFTDYKSRRPSYMSRQPEPLSSREDFTTSSSSFASPMASGIAATRQRRSTSQMRYPTSSNRYSQPSMMSEYQAAYGTLSRQSRATSQLRASSPVIGVSGANDGLFQSNGRDSGADSGHDDDDCNNNHNNNSDDEMSSYRPSNYVPKVVPEYPIIRKRPSRDFRRQSVLRDSSPVGRESRVSQRRTSLQNYSNLDRKLSPDRPTASWRSTLKELASPPTSSRDSSPVASSARRRSSGTTLVAEPTSGSIGEPTSRLSELEQRIKANQRRREQMLMGRYSPMPDSTPPRATRGSEMKATRVNGTAQAKEETQDLE